MSSPSNSIADSSMTVSSAKIGASALTASAIASDGRESISSSEPFCRIVIVAMKVLSRSSVTQTRTTWASSSPSAFVNRSCVSGRGVAWPWSFMRIAAASDWPIQIGR